MGPAPRRPRDELERIIGGVSADREGFTATQDREMTRTERLCVIGAFEAGIQQGRTEKWWTDESGVRPMTSTYMRKLAAEGCEQRSGMKDFIPRIPAGLWGLPAQ